MYFLSQASAIWNNQQYMNMNTPVIIDTKGSDLLDPVTEKLRGRNEYVESLGSCSASKEEDVSYCVSSAGEIPRT